MKRLIHSEAFHIVLILLLVASLPATSAEAQSPTLLYGRILDGSTLQPIGDATVQVLDGYSNVVKAMRTDGQGYYSVSLDKASQPKAGYRVCAYYDDVSTPGFDYVPVFKDVDLTGEKNLTLMLKPGGSIVVEGELRLVESSKPAEISSIVAIDPKTGATLSDENYFYGAGQDILRLGPRRIIVPAHALVGISIQGWASVGSQRVSKTIRLDGDALILEKGEEKRVGMEPAVSRLNFALVSNGSELAKGSLDDVEGKGFYVTLERQDLAKVNGLIDSAEKKLADGSYDAAHADLREAYLATLEVDRRVNEMYVNASSSATVLTFFLVLTAVVLSSILFERRVLKALGVGAFSGLFLSALYVIYPGTRLVGAPLFLLGVVLSLVVALSAYSLLPRFADERFVSIFFLGKENLRRRRLRFALTLISVTVLAMSFVTFTSFSTGYGLTSRSSTVSGAALEGLLVRRPLPPDLSETMSFVPLEVSTVPWLQGKQGVSAVAPKFENTPQLTSIGALSSSKEPSKRIMLFGVLGVEPDLEAGITHLDGSVIKGRYLNGSEENGVLISRVAAERLGADVGDGLVLNGRVSGKFQLVGILDDNRFSLARDVDSQPLMPSKLVRTIIDPDQPPVIEVLSCDPSEVVVMNWQAAVEVFGASLSRVDVELSDRDAALSLARQIALERDMSVWSSYQGVVHHVALESYVEAKGSSVMIPWIIVVLNVVITMLNSMFERRKEIAILSSVGLNPSQIAGIFMAEAAVIGVVGGGTGYLLGLSGYRGMLTLSIAVEVRQKVSAVWSLASLGVAVAAVLVGTIIALRSSVVITPSLMRRWTKGQRLQEAGGSWESQIPIRLHEEDVDALFDYLKRRIHSRILFNYPGIDRELVMKRTREAEANDPEVHAKSLDFQYFLGQTDYLSSSPFSLVAERRKGEETYSLRMISKGAEEGTVEKRVTLVRMMIVEWEAQRK